MSNVTPKPPAWRAEVLTWANSVTLVRALCTIGMILFAAYPGTVFALAFTGAVSDAVDGLLAKWRGATKFGARFDQYTDWCFGISLLYAIYRAESLIWDRWPYNVALLGMIGGYLLVRAMLPHVDTNGAAKLKTFLQFAGAVVILGSHAFAWDVAHMSGYLLVWSSVGLMGKSLWDYLKAQHNSARPL